MWFIFVLSWLATFVHVCLATLALAAGLYYLAELVEEYTVITMKILRWVIIATAGIYVGLILFEDLPFRLTLTGLVSIGVYSLLLRTFPFIELTSPVFIGSCVLVIINHYLAFQYFAEVWHPFSEVIAYFTMCLWLVPFGFFISLSANDNVLPTTHMPTETKKEDVVTNYFNKRSKRSGVLSVFDMLKDTLIPERTKRF
ncbi:protein TEX261-like [Patiria miniata]|uniref:Protein TEX261 n=1 Tax=Patiria miniata TaxID=46514 RepID=A0A914B439_PATMI|nr:protein TEX261-like [Patiria miniata]